MNVNPSVMVTPTQAAQQAAQRETAAHAALEAQLAGWVEEALALRHGEVEGAPAPSAPGVTDGPQEVYESLVAIRRRLDRVEALQVATVRAHGRASRAAKEAENVTVDAWDQALAAARSRHQRAERSEGFTGPRERYAEANLAVLDQRIVARRLERVADVAKEAQTVVRACREGLEGLRAEHLARLRALSFESSLER